MVLVLSDTGLLDSEECATAEAYAWLRIDEEVTVDKSELVTVLYGLRDDRLVWLKDECCRVPK